MGKSSKSCKYNRFNMKCACREYLDSTVVPVLRDGLRMLVKERPEDPCNYLVDYIKANHP